MKDNDKTCAGFGKADPNSALTKRLITEGLTPPPVQSLWGIQPYGGGFRVLLPDGSVDFAGDLNRCMDHLRWLLDGSGRKGA